MAQTIELAIQQCQGSHVRAVHLVGRGQSLDSAQPGEFNAVCQITRYQTRYGTPYDHDHAYVSHRPRVGG
jgi:hypothetical protein